MSFDYSAAKAAIKEAGHNVSNGPQILATDIKELVKFGRRVFGLSEVAVRKGIANTSLLPEGFPGVAAAPVTEAVDEPVPAPEAAPVVAETPAEASVTPEAEPAQQDAPEQEAAPAEDAPKAKKLKKGDDSTAPADTAAQDAPAGDQAAQ
jgi:type IV secretory pathway VirB10-like protein